MKFTPDIYFGMAVWMIAFALMLYRSIKYPDTNREEDYDE